MIWIRPLAQVQTATEISGQLQHIAWAETATAIGMVIVAVLGIGLAVATLSMVRALGRLLITLERISERLAPRAEPLIERVAEIADDAAAISGSLREEAERFRGTLEDLNRQVRTAAESARERARHFGAVIDAVQAEVEEMLLDAAAAARGLYATAESLRHPALPPRGESKGDSRETPRER